MRYQIRRALAGDGWRTVSVWRTLSLAMEELRRNRRIWPHIEKDAKVGLWDQKRMRFIA